VYFFAGPGLVLMQRGGALTVAPVEGLFPGILDP